jgi:hypothetical protein
MMIAAAIVGLNLALAEWAMRGDERRARIRVRQLAVRQL